MANNPQNRSSWRGRNFRVEIPFSRAGVAHHIWVGSKDSSLLFDAGDGVLRDLLEMSIPLERIDAIFITHGHFDHMGGLHSLLGFMRMIGRSRQLTLYMPEGCLEARRVCEVFSECYRTSIPFEICIDELSPRARAAISGVTVEMYPLVHCGSIAGGGILDPIPAAGYRIVCDDEVIAISGDTGVCDSLRRLVDGADLAIIEATYLSSSGKEAGLLDKVHLSEDIAGEIGRTAKEFILVHKGRRE